MASKSVAINYSHISDQSFTLGNLKDWIISQFFPINYMERESFTACFVSDKQQTWDFCLENLKTMESKVVTFTTRDSITKELTSYVVTVDFV
jgi:hypothetical protein